MLCGCIRIPRITLRGLIQRWDLRSSVGSGPGSAITHSFTSITNSSVMDSAVDPTAVRACADDVGDVPFAMGHYIENIGDTPVRFLEMFRSSYYADVSL